MSNDYTATTTRSNTRRSFSIGLFHWWFLLFSELVSSYSTEQYKHGVSTSHVVTLNKDNFHKAITNDPTNSFWFLKFFAPWCGHCKKLAPVLDRVAPQTAGTMSIGTIDCTVEKKLCDQHKVRGYPTLKYAIDGEIYNYDGGRNEYDFIELSKKMLRPIIDSIDSFNNIQEYLLEKTDNGIAFIFYDPSISITTTPSESTKSSSLEINIVTTPLGQLFIQLSRKFRASGSFVVLTPSESMTPNDIASFMQLNNNNQNKNDGNTDPFLCRIENDVPPQCYDTLEVTTPLKQLVEWVEEKNVPTVSQLGAHNFYKLGRNGRPLAIAIIDEQDKEQLDLVKTEFTNFAINGPTNIRNKYYYAYFDGNVWKNFLTQFEVYPHDIPQVLVLDVPMQSYYQNATYRLNVNDYLIDIDRGKIKLKFAVRDGLDGQLMLLYRIILSYRPWSIMIIAVLLVSILVGIWLCVRPAKEIRKVKTAQRVQSIPTTPPTTTITEPEGDTATLSADALKEGSTKKDK